MVDFANGNMCGASPELNDVLSKLDEAKADIKSKLDAVASTAAAAFESSKNELAGLKDKLQTIEIPTLPKLNLQAEIASLTSQAPGSVSFASALSKIKTEFGDDIKAAGLDVETLVNSAVKEVSAGGNICSIVPNLEKTAGDTAAALEKPAAVKQAAAKAVTEIASVIEQNKDIKVKTDAIAVKMTQFKTTSSPPTTDTPAFKFVPSSSIKNFSVAPGAVPAKAAIAPTSASQRKNYVPKDKGDGFAYKKSINTETFAVDDIPRRNGKFHPKLEVQSDGYYVAALEYKPSRISRIFIYPGESFTRELIGESQRKALGFEEPSTIANKQFLYSNLIGRHVALLYVDKGSKIHSPRTNISVMGNNLRFFSPITLSTHPGNIDSGGYAGEPDDRQHLFARSGYEPLLNGAYNSSARHGSDTHENRIRKGFSVLIRYEFLEKYDPDY